DNVISRKTTNNQEPKPGTYSILFLTSKRCRANFLALVGNFRRSGNRGISNGRKGTDQSQPPRATDNEHYLQARPRHRRRSARRPARSAQLFGSQGSAQAAGTERTPGSSTRRRPLYLQAHCVTRKGATVGFEPGSQDLL